MGSSGVIHHVCQETFKCSRPLGYGPAYIFDIVCFWFLKNAFTDTLPASIKSAERLDVR